MKRPSKSTVITRPHDYRLVTDKASDGALPQRRMVCADCGALMSAGVVSCPGKSEQLRRDLGKILGEAMEGAGE